MNGFYILFPLIHFHFLCKMKGDSAVNIGRLCFLGTKEVLGLDRSPQAQLSLSVTAHSHELVRIKAVFEMKCDVNTEKWWHSFWNITTLLESVAMAKWDTGKGISKNPWLYWNHQSQHNKQIKFLRGFLTRPLVMTETSVSIGHEMAGQGNLASPYITTANTSE